MGNNISYQAMFEKEITSLNNIVSSIINEKNVFVNKDYNFLSQDVCKSYHVVLEEELQKHLKIYIKNLGTSLYVLPRKEDNSDLLTKHNLSKSEICSKISNHYIKILYVLSLIKYVYNLEKNGENSIAGIMFRNVKLVDDILEITFCELPHKDYTKNKNKIDFSLLEGMDFFVNFFLSPEEAQAFLDVYETFWARNTKQKVENTICKNNKRMFYEMYESRFKEKIQCGGGMRMFVNKDNPILSTYYCYAGKKIIVKTSTPHGKVVYELYKQMAANYKKNVADIQKLLNMLVYKDKLGGYHLKDITLPVLNNIIEMAKKTVSHYYIQSVVDFQNLFDAAQKVPNISAGV